MTHDLASNVSCNVYFTERDNARNVVYRFLVRYVPINDAEA